jgi:hypothetical protein
MDALNVRLWGELRRGAFLKNKERLEAIYDNLSANKDAFKYYIAECANFTIKEACLLIRLIETSQQNYVNEELAKNFKALFTEVFPIATIEKIRHKKLQKCVKAVVGVGTSSLLRQMMERISRSFAMVDMLSTPPQTNTLSNSYTSEGRRYSVDFSFSENEEQQSDDEQLRKAIELSMQSYDVEQRAKRPRITVEARAKFTCGFPTTVVEERLRGQLTIANEEDRPKCPICLEPPTDFAKDAPRLLQLNCECKVMIHHECLEGQLKSCGKICPVCKKAIRTLEKL